jgi:hypothetical protein
MLDGFFVVSKSISIKQYHRDFYTSTDSIEFFENVFYATEIRMIYSLNVALKYLYLLVTKQNQPLRTVTFQPVDLLPKKTSGHQFDEIVFIVSTTCHGLATETNDKIVFDVSNPALPEKEK